MTSHIYPNNVYDFIERLKSAESATSADAVAQTVRRNLHERQLADLSELTSRPTFDSPALDALLELLNDFCRGEKDLERYSEDVVDLRGDELWHKDFADTYGGTLMLRDCASFCRRIVDEKVSGGLATEIRQRLAPEYLRALAGVTAADVDGVFRRARWNALLERIVTILNDPQLIPAGLLKDDKHVRDDGRCFDVNETLCAEYERIYGGALYLKHPKQFIARCLSGTDDAAIQWIRAHLSAADLAADLATVVRRVTALINRPAFRNNFADPGIGDLREIRPYAPDAIDNGEAPRSPVNPHLIAALARTSRSALCVSGGGIRSATFNLGVFEGLARNGLLDQFDFLSTCSGGGFIGGWLSAWVRRRKSGLRQVIRELKRSPEAEEVRYLRSYSNYLAPETGMFSPDTWVIISTFIRNILVTWMTFVPATLAVILLPRILYTVMFHPVLPAEWSLYLGFAFGTVAIAYVGLQLPGVSRSEESSDPFEAVRKKQQQYVFVSLAPLVASAFFLSKAAWDRPPTLPGLVEFVVLLVLAGWIPAAIKLGFRSPPVRLRWLVGITLLLIGAAALSAVAAYPLLPLVGWLRALGVEGRVLFLCFAPSITLGLMLLSGTLLAAITSNATTVEAEEWWARSGAYILIALVVWSVAFVLDLELPGYVVFSISHWSSQLWKESIKILGTSGVVIALLAVVIAGWRGKLSLLTGILAPAVVAYLVICYSALVDVVLYQVQPGRFLRDHFAIVDSSDLRLILTVFLILGAITAITEIFINGNKFIPHYFYQNRIIKAYQAASHKHRAQDPFTGLDDDDDLSMSELRRQRPLHVLSITLNVLGSERLAWQERKAESFTVSPFHSGSPWLGYRDSMLYGGKRGISLGTAVALSGAGLSPEMGYMLSSSAVRFLMAVFAVRLGCWLGNPGKKGDKTFRRSEPVSALIPVASEALGIVNEDSSYVYLTDGGHFDNLALYEMVMRGCSHIVVSDASCDPDYTFECLAIAIRKVRIDFGIPIEFPDFGKFGLLKDHADRYCAVGIIRYSVLDPTAPDGTLLYVKAAMTGTEPRDVIEYAKQTGTFPQQSADENFFSESQFESYRALGVHIMQWISSGHEGKRLPLFIDGVRQDLYKLRATD